MAGPCRRVMIALLLVALLPGCSTGRPDGTPSAAASRPAVAPATIGPTPGHLSAGERCPVTQASDRPDEPPAAAARWNTGADNLYGGSGLWVVLPSWPAVHHEGRYDLKFGWWRQTDGQLRVSAASLESTDRVTVDVSDGYGHRAFQPTVVGFTRTGCWLATGTLGATEVRFVVNVKTN